MKKTLALLVLATLFVSGCDDCIPCKASKAVATTEEPPRMESLGYRRVRVGGNSYTYSILRDSHNGDEYMVILYGSSPAVMRLSATGHNAPSK